MKEVGLHSSQLEELVQVHIITMIQVDITTLPPPKIEVLSRCPPHSEFYKVTKVYITGISSTRVDHNPTRKIRCTLIFF